MNLQLYYDFSARHLLTQNKTCSINGKCICQSGTLRCALACFAVENDVTIYGNYNGGIPSIKIRVDTCEDLTLLGELIVIHDKSRPTDWPTKLHELAIKHGLQPFSPSDLSGGRGCINPLAIWYTNPTERAKLLEAHKIAGTSHLLTNYLAAFPEDTGGVRESVLPAESQGVE